MESFGELPTRRVVLFPLIWCEMTELESARRLSPQRFDSNSVACSFNDRQVFTRASIEGRRNHMRSAAFVLALAISPFAFGQTQDSSSASTQTSSSGQASSQTEITPQRGQSAADQQKDLRECFDIAKSRTGVDPSTLSAAASKIPGAGAAPSTDANPADSAAGKQVGSATGMAREATGSAAGAAPSSDVASKMSTFDAANKACLQARGYVVKGATGTMPGAGSGVPMPDSKGIPVPH